MRRLSLFFAGGLLLAALALAPFAFAQVSYSSRPASVAIPTCTGAQVLTGNGTTMSCTTPAGGASTSSANTWTALQTFNAGEISVADYLLRNVSGYLFWSAPSAQDLLIPSTGQALNTTMTGVHNIALGSQPLANVSTGSYNIAIGNGSVLSGTFSGSSNVAIGEGAAGGNAYGSAASNNVAIGAGAGPASGAASAANNQICIGATCTMVGGDGVSNQAVIGNASITNTYLRGTVNTPSLTIGSGTAITASYRATASLTPAAVGAGGIVTATITVTGAAAGADCLVTGPGTGNLVVIHCAVTANTCNIGFTNPGASSQTPISGVYACRVFNP